MPEKNAKSDVGRHVEQYEHADKKRTNNPQVGLVNPDTDPAESVQVYAFDPHQDPTLDWAGKKEHTSFEVPTVSLYVHERIDPRSILRAVRRKGVQVQLSLFSTGDQNLPFREEIQFYKHSKGWVNRLIAGDSLLTMNSLIEKEALSGRVQMVYFDPPYGIRYMSNFQPYVDQRSVSETDKDEDLESSPEMVKAFQDTWELGIHSYLSYIRDRLLLAHKLLSPGGSIFVQISDENLHLVRAILDEIFGSDCFVVTIPFKKKGSQKSGSLDPVNDYVIWYSRSPRNETPMKFHPLFVKRELDEDTLSDFRHVDLGRGRVVNLTKLTRPDGTKFDYRTNARALFEDYPRARLFTSENITAGGIRRTQSVPFLFEGKTYNPPPNGCWKHSAISDDGSKTGMQRLAEAGRLMAGDATVRYKRYLDDFGYQILTNWWDALGGAANPIYVVQTNPEVIKRCVLMTTEPGDLVLDITCGSGTTAVVAEEWGRRWIVCDTSRVALSLSKQRIMTQVFAYYRLRQPEEGIGSGLVYKRVPHVTSSTIANAEDTSEEELVDVPEIDADKVRVTGPFTVEAVPSPVVLPLDGVTRVAGDSEDAARSGPTLRQSEWRAQLSRTGIKGAKGQVMRFSRLEPLGGSRFIHAIGESTNGRAGIVAVSFGPEFAPMEPRQVQAAYQEAYRLAPRPEYLLFAAFEFDPEAGKNIDDTDPKTSGMTFLKVKMNNDLLTRDLKKKERDSESFFFIGQPDANLIQLTDGPDHGKWVVEVLGADYFDVAKGELVSRSRKDIAMWMLDPDYDGKSLFPQQVFFPLADENRDWTRLAKTLKAEIDENRIRAYSGHRSMPFKLGENRRVAVKVIDRRGIESMRVLVA